MELRHLRCFTVLAEELHFTRAAERLHIEQSPLSRTIKELEEDLGVLLFDRDRRGTKLTQAGYVFLQDVRRVFTTLEQARENVRAIAAGYHGSLRIAVSDGAAGPKLSAFLARCREDLPEVEVRISETPLSEQCHGLRNGSLHLGFAYADEVGVDIIAEPIWQEPLVLAIPSRHPLLAFKSVPLEELARYPLLMCDTNECESFNRALQRILRKIDVEPIVAETVISRDMMFTLVAAGYGIGFTTATKLAVCGHLDVISRPLDTDAAFITTYLLRSESNSTPTYLDEFVARLHALTETEDDTSAPGTSAL